MSNEKPSAEQQNPPPPRRLERWFAEYGANHQTAGNRLTHAIGIPMIAVSLLGLAARVQFGAVPGFVGNGFFRLDLGIGLWAASLLWYVFLDWKLALPFGLFSIGVYLLGRSLNLPWQIALFVIGWILQGIGHYRYEKRSPSFFTNIRNLLIGPLWLFAKAIGYPETQA